VTLQIYNSVQRARGLTVTPRHRKWIEFTVQQRCHTKVRYTTNCRLWKYVLYKGWV